MDRREFLRLTAYGTTAIPLSAIVSGCTGPIGKATTRQPNILLITSDDHAAHAISCYGSKINHTPNIDRLAREGMRFDNCFCTNSICTPSRAAVLTGKYSHKNGCLTLDDRFDGTQTTFVKLLQKAGYHTGIVGKWHLKSDPTGFDYWNILPGQGKYNDPVTIEMGQRQEHQGYVTDIITDLSLEFLKNRPADKPFCLLYHHKAPHDMFIYDKKHAHLYEDADIPEPDNLFDDYRNRGDAIKRCTQKVGMRHTLYKDQTEHLSGKARKKLQYQIYIKKYLRCVASIDDNIGRVLDYLDANGLADDTIVVYTSDQGFFLGEHGLYDKRFMYEESLRIPFIVRYPREIKPAGVDDNIVLYTDFAETFLDYAGLAIPPDMQGRSLRPLLNGKTPPDWRSSMYYRYWMHRAHFDVAAHMGVRTKRYKLIYYYGQPLGAKGAKDEPTDPEWELFDLQNDPGEMNNVYNDPAYQKIVKQLKAELIKLRRELDDEDSIIVPVEKPSYKT